MKKFLIWVFVILLFALGGTYVLNNNVCYSDGERSGEVIKFSRKGVIFKTWEGELIQRNLSIPQEDTWHFSVKDNYVAQQINESMATGERVILHYCQVYIRYFWWGETEYFIDKVTKVKMDNINQPANTNYQHY